MLNNETMSSDTVLQKKIDEIEKTLLGFKTAQPMTTDSWVGYEYTYVDRLSAYQTKKFVVDFLPDTNIESINQCTVVVGRNTTSWRSIMADFYASDDNPNRFYIEIQEDFGSPSVMTIFLRTTQPGSMKVTNT